MFRLDVYHHFAGEEQFTRILAALTSLTGKVNTMALDLTDVTAATARIETLCANVSVELTELAAAVGNAVTAGDLAALQEVQRRLTAAADGLAAVATSVDPTPGTPVE